MQEKNYYNDIKNKLIDNEIYAKIKDYSKERNRVITYYEVGRLLSEAGKHYGEGVIKDYSKRLKRELNKNYSVRLLYRMLKYYNFVTSQNLPTLSAKISWSHYDEILKFNDASEIIYYINISYDQRLSIRQLREKIKSNEYERLPESTKRKLIKKEESNIIDYVKNPIIIKNNGNYEIINEQALQRLILENIEEFVLELGNSYAFIGSEYKIKLGDRNNYIDLLLFNYEYNCFVVVELKVTELKKEHIGQIEIYMNYIDNHLRKFGQNKTIGIIICKENNLYVIKYCSDKRIISRSYELVS